MIETFTCPNHSGELKISPNTCASMFRRARKPDQDALRPCLGCAVGAANAGEVNHEAKHQARCVWCGSAPTPGRGLVHKLFCISCSNRIAEVLRGKFRRDRPPKQLTKFRAYEVHL